MSPQGKSSKRKGASIVFLNRRSQVLLQLRDDIPYIPYPNMWDLPGGHVESSETPEQCIAREMKEEMGLEIAGFHLFSVKEFDDRVEYTYWMSMELDIGAVRLSEGQALRWFTEEEVRVTPLAYGFNGILAEFFEWFGRGESQDGS